MPGCLCGVWTDWTGQTDISAFVLLDLFYNLLKSSREMADTEPAPEAPVNATGKIPATPEGMMVAYGSLVIMALIPIFLGSFRSIESQKEQKENHVSYQLDPSYSVWM